MRLLERKASQQKWSKLATWTQYKQNYFTLKRRRMTANQQRHHAEKRCKILIPFQLDPEILRMTNKNQCSQCSLWGHGVSARWIAYGPHIALAARCSPILRTTASLVDTGLKSTKKASRRHIATGSVFEDWDDPFTSIGAAATIFHWPPKYGCLPLNPTKLLSI